MDLRLGRLLDGRDEGREELVGGPDDPFRWVPVEGIGSVSEVAAVRGRGKEERGLRARREEETDEEEEGGQEESRYVRKLVMEVVVGFSGGEEGEEVVASSRDLRETRKGRVVRKRTFVFDLKKDGGNRKMDSPHRCKVEDQSSERES